MQLTNEQIRFLTAAVGKDEARENLMVMWASPKPGVAFSTNGYVLHATKAECEQPFAFRPFKYDEQIEISLDGQEKLTMPDIRAIKPKKPQLSMQINPGLLLNTLKALPNVQSIRLTVYDTVEYTGDGKLLVIQTDDDDCPFYALIMGMYHDSHAGEDWSPFDGKPEQEKEP